MKANNYISSVLLIVAIIVLSLVSCEKFFDPEPDLIIKDKDFYKNWNEYRSAEMGLYSLQQELVDQIVVLGELRGDLLEVTKNASKDLQDIYNFNISPDNAYASPYKFYQLIGACNKLALKLETDQQEVLDKSAAITVYDRLYGEVLCMRAWAYFNAVKIYGRVPYLWPSLTSSDEITDYIHSPQVYYDVREVSFAKNGHDTIVNILDTLVLNKVYLDMNMVIDTFTRQLPEKIKSVGVIHNLENGDQTWDVTIWNKNAYNVLMGEMHLSNSNLTAAYNYFEPILFNYDSETSNIKYGLDGKFAKQFWASIFTGIDPYEHILTLPFDKTYQQQNSLQTLFSDLPPNKYMLKPTRLAVENWETTWSGTDIEKNLTDPTKTIMLVLGIPGDFYRGYGVSYIYRRGADALAEKDVRQILSYKSTGNYRDVENLMSMVDTVVYKYSINKGIFDHDANYIIYRAASVHLYCSEIYTYWLFERNGFLNTDINKSLSILNNGAYKDPPNANQLGVRGRAGFGRGDDAVYIENQIYLHDPYTNEITGFLDYTNNLSAKQAYLEDQIMQERARELAFEGTRFYDLIRVAKRRGDPSYLADKVAAKFSGAKAQQIRNLLMNEENWYVPLPE